MAVAVSHNVATVSREADRCPSFMALAAARSDTSFILPLPTPARVVTGTVGRNVEVNDDEMNFVAPTEGQDPAELSLLKPRSLKEIQSLFYSY